MPVFYILSLIFCLVAIKLYWVDVYEKLEKNWVSSRDSRLLTVLLIMAFIPIMNALVGTMCMASWFQKKEYQA